MNMVKTENQYYELISKRNYLSIFIICLIITGLFACKRPPKGALSPEARTMLDSLAFVGTFNEAKYMKLADEMKILLDEALAKSSNRAVMNHLATFELENELALRYLRHEIDLWLTHMTDEERIAFYYRLRNEPFTRPLNSLSTRFRNRMRQDPASLQKFEELYSCLYWRK